MNRNDVYKLIDGERDYQEERWNSKVTDTGHNHSPEDWVMYMYDYIQEAMHLLSREASPVSRPKAMEIVRKVTAFGVAAMEQHETKAR